MKNFNPEDYVGKTYYYTDGTEFKIIYADSVCQEFDCVKNNSYYIYIGFDYFQEQIEYHELLTKEQLDELKKKEGKDVKKKQILTENLIYYLKIKEDAEKNISEILKQLKEY